MNDRPEAAGNGRWAGEPHNLGGSRPMAAHSFREGTQVIGKRGLRLSFSLIELLATAVILSILSVMGAPYAQTVKDRQVEIELKIALLKIRTAIDSYAYNETYDATTHPQDLDQDGVRGEDGVGDPDGDGLSDDDWDGRVDEDGPPFLPAKLEDLVTRGYLPHIPRDPLSEKPSEKATWTLKYLSRSFTVGDGKTVNLTGIVDISSTSRGIGLSGLPYSQW